MMKTTCKGVAETMRRAMREAGDPVITVSTPRSLEAVAQIDPDARVVIDSETLESVGWSTLGRLADADDAALRESSVPNDVVVGREIVASIDHCVSPSVGVLGQPSDSVVERYESLWDATEPLELDCPTHAAVIDTVTAVATERAASDVSQVCRSLRHEATTDAVAVTVWGSAAASPKYETLREHLPDELDVCERTVRDRIDQLLDAGLVRRRPDPGHGGRGRPPTVVERLADPPLPAPLRGALLR